jgi:hypothetical protein
MLGDPGQVLKKREMDHPTHTTHPTQPQEMKTMLEINAFSIPEDAELLIPMEGSDVMESSAVLSLEEADDDLAKLEKEWEALQDKLASTRSLKHMLVMRSEIDSEQANAWGGWS